MRKIMAVMALSALCFASNAAWAIDLSQARAQGVVGENKVGYVEKLGGGADVAAMVADVNAKRLAEYKRISAENGQSVDVVAKLAANQIVGGLPSGAKYQDANGNWQKK
jgi:uncharacterized protein YdbL (DUF1318 family)